MELKPDALLRTVDAAALPFATTAEITPREAPIAQERAREALDFSVGMQFPGYNVYALGSNDTDKRELISGRLQTLAQDDDTPDDWCYVQNFQDPARPHCVRLPAGQGRRLRRDMQEFISRVRAMVRPRSPQTSISANNTR